MRIDPGPIRDGQFVRRNLVAVRAGDTSLHEDWLGEERSWDLIVSYFGKHPTRYMSRSYGRVTAPGGKWEGLYELFTSEPSLLDRYDYVWLPDDDIKTDCATINKLFDTMKANDLYLAQPSLHPASYFQHQITVRSNTFRLRYANFVELMVPCFSTEFLRTLVPFFAGRRYGWGLDRVWAFLMDEPSFRTAIIDECEVMHTRPYKVGPLYTEFGAGDPEEEEAEVLRAFGLDRDPPSYVYGGVSRAGCAVRGVSFLALAVSGAIGTASRVRHPPDGRVALLRNLLTSCIRFNLTPLQLQRGAPGCCGSSKDRLKRAASCS